MEIVDAQEPSRVAIDLRFEKPFKARNETVLAIVPEGEGGSRVTWTMNGQKTLMTRYRHLQVDGLAGRPRLREGPGPAEGDRGALSSAAAAAAGRQRLTTGRGPTGR